MKTKLKAVEMLQEIAIRLDPFDNKIELALLDGVFAELAELMQGTSCDGCEYQNTSDGVISSECYECVRYASDHYTPKG